MKEKIMKKFCGFSYDITDLISDGQINYVVGLLKNDADQLSKLAHIPSREEIEEMPNEDFALVLHHSRIGQLKKFATHDRYITQLNMKIFETTHGDYPDEISKTAAHYLCKAAKHFRLDIPEEIKKLGEGSHASNIVDLDSINETAWVKKQASMVKEAKEIEYALPDKRKYPISTSEHIKTAVAYFNEHAYKFDPADALQYAVRVKLAADKAGVAYDGTLLAKYATLTASSYNPDMKTFIRARRGYVLEEDRPVYDELLEKSASFGVIKTAEVLEKVDRKFGLHRQWGVNIEDPYISVLGMRKEAECMVGKKKVTKKNLVKAAESVVDKDTLRDLEGPDGIAVFESLPKPLQDKIVKEL